MPKMTKELQEAYNEWLLRWGYREVTIDEIMQWGMGEVLRKILEYVELKPNRDNISYARLKTPEEVECQK